VLSRRRRSSVPDDGWTDEVTSGYALAGFLALVFVGFTLLSMGPLLSIDTFINLAAPPHAWLPVLHVLDRIGQRAVCLPILGLVTFLACRRQESWRPGWVVAISVFMLNLIVLILKVGLGRGEPEASNPHFFAGGMAYPSGHTGNIVLVYGLVAYLLGRYLAAGRRAQAALWSAVAFLSVVMVVTSMTLSWHWFGDLVAGLLVGGFVLQMTVAVDAAVPEDAFRRGWRDGLRRVGSALRHGAASNPR
jgi:membrane-associated phospholipid phosphatase